MANEVRWSNTMIQFHNSGMVLTDTGNGALVQDLPRGTLDQLFHITQVDMQDGLIVRIASAAHPGLFVDVTGDRHERANRLTLFKDLDGRAQRFSLVFKPG